MTASTKLVKSESIPLEIPVNNGAKQIFFPDDQYIRNKKLMSLYITLGYYGQQYIDGKPLVQYDILPYGYLTLESYSGTQFVRRKPLIQFVNYNNGGVEQAFFFNFIGQRVNWPKSYIEFAPNVQNVAVPSILLFDVQFTELTQERIKKELGVGFNNKS